MRTINDRIDMKLRKIYESIENDPALDYTQESYDRQEAEDRLFHTIGPLTDNPRWVNTPWSSPSAPPENYVPGGPAPRWTQDQLVMAMAGDPSLAGRPGAKDNPKSPAYGNKGGAPVWRLARQVARVYNRAENFNFILDLYSNGLVALTKMMQPGYDQSKSPFISFAIRTIKANMENGLGATREGIQAAGGDSTTGVSGLSSLEKAKTPEEAMRIANQVKGKYQTTKSHDKNPDNPFGAYSSRIYQLAVAYAQALSSGSEEALDKVKNRIIQLKDDIEDDSVVVPGAATGIGQAISTGDRKSHVGVTSMNAPTGENGEDMSGNIAANDYDDSYNIVDPESVFYVLDVALAQNINNMIAKYPWVQEVAVNAGMKPGESLGPMTANELRFVIRLLGPLGSNYPGKGTPRSNTKVPRDAVKWWKAGEDPEIEIIPSNGQTWTSIWARNGYEAMGPTEISREMTDEVKEFNQLGIPTAREVKAKAKVEEAISKVSVANATRSAIIKMTVIGALNKESYGVHKDLYKDDLRKVGFPILEDYDPIDRRIIIETTDWIIRKLTRAVALIPIENKRRINESKSNIAWSAINNTRSSK